MQKKYFRNLCFWQFVFVLIFASLNFNARTKDDSYYTALKFYEQKEYSSAYKVFYQLMNDDRVDEIKRISSKFYAGDCLFNIMQYDGAALLFESFINENNFSNFKELSLFKLGEIYFSIGSYRKCRERLFTLLEAYPESEYKGASYYWIAESYAAEKKYLEAEEYFKEAISLRKNNQFIVNSFFSLAQLYENIGNFTNAVEYYDELLTYYKYDPLAQLAQLRIGISYFNLKEYDSAVLELTDPLIKKLPIKEQIEAKYYLANSYMRLKDYKNAIAILNELKQEKLSLDMTRKVNYSMAWVKFQTNDFEGAYKIFHELFNDESDTLAISSLFWSGECKRYMGDIKRANEIYKLFIEKYPSHSLAARAQLSKGTVFYTSNQSIDAEASLINATISNDAQTKCRAYTLLGELKLNGKLFSEAKNYFSSAIKFANDDVQLNNRAKLGLGISEFYLNNYNSAAQYLEDLNKNAKDFESDKVNFYLAETYLFRGEYTAALKHYNQVSSSDELLKKQTLLGKAYAYFNQKDFANAVYYFNDYVSKYRNENNINDVKLRLADSYFGLKNFEKASSIYKEIFSQDKSILTNDQAYYQYCQSLFKAGKSTEAIQAFANLQRKFPRSKYADASQYVIGWIHFQRNDFRSAIENYRALINRFPNSSLIPIAYYSIGDSYYNLGEYDSSIVYYNKVLEEYPNTQYIIDAVNGIQYAYIAKDQPEMAVSFIEQFISANPNLKLSDQIYFKKGDIYYSSDNYAKASEAYKDFIQRYPKSSLVPNAYFWTGKSAANLKKENEAIENFNKVLEISKKSDIGISAAVELSNIYSNKKLYPSAIQVLNSVIDAVPTSNRLPELLYLKAKAEVNDNKINGAYSTFEQIINYYEGNIFAAKAKVELGILELNRNNYENALQLLKEVAQNRLDDIGAQAQYYYGLALFNQNKIADAITAFVRVRSIFSAYDEWYTKSLLRLGDCYVKLNDKKLAREMYRAVISRHRTGEFAIEANKKLKQL